MVFILELIYLKNSNSIVLYAYCNNGRASYDATYFDSYGVEHIPKEIKKCL